MDNEVNVISKQLYESIQEIINDIFKLLIELIIDFEKKWGINVNAQNIRFSSVDEVKDEISNLGKQILRDNKQCTVLGRTSSGKSTLINSLLKENILPSGLGSTSNCFIEVKTSPTNYSYLVVNGSEIEYPVNDITKLNEELDDQNLKNRSLIHLFYDSRRCELLNEDVVIIDTPGLDTHIYLDTCIEDLCKETDVILLLINAMGGLSLTEKDVISKHKNIFSNLTVLIIYTFWDKVQKKDRNDRVKEKHIKKAKTFLCNELNYSDERARNSIYFVSGEERLGIVSFKSPVNSVINNELFRERNKNFDVFFKFLKKILCENAVHRKYNYLKEIYSKASSFIMLSELSINQMFLKREELVLKIKSNLEKMDKMNEKINGEITKILTSAFGELILKGIEAVEIDEKKKTEQRKSSLISLEMIEDELGQKLQMIFEDIADRSLIKLKRKIIELIHDEDEEIYSTRKQIFEELYFPNYFDLKDEKSSFDFDILKTNLLQIRKKVKTGTIATICSTAGFAFLGIVTGGASIVALGLVQLGLVAGAAIGVGGAAAAAAGGGTSFGIIKALKNPFTFFWKNNVIEINTMWHMLELALLNSYSVFIDDLRADIEQLFSPFLTEFRRMQNKLNAFKDELDNFHNYSVTS